MYEFKKLFEKNYIGTMELKNRICFAEQAPQAKNGFVTQMTEDFYVARAKGGAGLVMVGGTCPDITGLGTNSMCRIDDDRYIPGFAKLAKAVHDAAPDVKVGLQIMHEGRQMRPDVKGAYPDIRPIAPSPVKFKFGVVPHELTVEEIHYQVDQYGEAARRIKEAGYDCVGLHGAHGYLITQFMSPYTNLRTDEYGGSPENKARFACEVIGSIKKKCGADFPVIIKINAMDFVEAEEQITPDLAYAIAPFLEKAGADEIHVSGGQHESPFIAPIGPYFIPKAVYADWAANVKKTVSIPVGAINRINDPILADELLVAGKVDLIWMLRALVADPEFPNKAAAGKLDEIRTCIACNTCNDILVQGWFHETRCAVNPDAWREGVSHIEPSLRTKKVLVVGGGPAGMEAARIGAQIGHDVTLWEKDAKLGGQLKLAAVPPAKEEIASITRYYTAQLDNLGVKVETGKEATASSVKELKPDVIIIASGSSTAFPPIPGIEEPLVADVRSVLAGTRAVGEEVVIIGGGEVGMETAQLLAGQGKKVTLLEMLPEIGENMGSSVVGWVKDELVKHGVEILTSTTVKEITKDGVLVEDAGGHKQNLAADTVVIATGSKSNTKVQHELQGLAREVYLAGDCLVPCDIRMSIHQGNITGRMLY
jgi:2,4-dienoyl-CoA reductase-like NADH-dependent reductase (Old Yellow Enzyme family)/thioredoxin reductase